MPKARPPSSSRASSPSSPPPGAASASSYEGLQGSVRALELPPLEVWENQYPDRDYRVRMEIPELTCLCPKTGLPDFATLCLEYVPDRWCVELKSLKLHVVAYRNVGIFHEHIVNKILEDFVKAVSPREARLRGDFGARGGITTTVVAAWPRPPGPIDAS